MAQVCRGLAYAHERGIVHRDIKPSNVRLLDDGTAKIMDFGIAKLGGTHLTKTGMMVGTVHYMSPEQVRGRPLDGRSDVFSAGVILYEMLGSVRPFRGDGATQVLYKIVNEEPPPLDLSALGAAGPRLSEIVSRALAKDVDARYPGAGAMAEAVAALQDELQRAAGSPPAAAVAAVADARRLAREGRHGEAATILRGVLAGSPGYSEARRALRSALRQQRRVPQPPATPDGYPELEATFQATATRRTASGELLPTVVVPTSGAGVAEPVEPASPEPPARRPWLWGALALAALGVVCAIVLLRGGRPAAGPVRLAVRSQPVGAAVLVDGRDSGVVTNGELLLQPKAPAQVVLTFRKPGHRDETRTVALPPSDPGGVSVTLEATVPLLTVKTAPPGASVSLDGARVAGTTPLQLALDAGAEHRISASLEGYLAQEARVARGEAPAVVELTLPKLAPPGTVAIASSYALDVLWRGKPLAHGSVAPRVEVPGGRQQLTLTASSVFLHLDDDGQRALGRRDDTRGARRSAGSTSGRARTTARCSWTGPSSTTRRSSTARPSSGATRSHSAGRTGGAGEQPVEVRRGAPAFVVGRKE